MSSVPLVLIAVSGAGWAVFAVGFIWNGITSPKHRMTRDEAAHFAQKRAPVPSNGSVARRTVRRDRFRGRAWGFSWSDELSFGELKAAYRRSRWRESVRYQQFALAAGGFLVGLFGLTLLIGWELGTIGFLAATAIVLYVLFQLTRAFSRA